MCSSYAYTLTYVQMKIFFSLIEKDEDQDVDMLVIAQKQAQNLKYN